VGGDDDLRFRPRGWDVFPLYSALPPAAQEAAIAPGPKPKIIVATNVAETSLTIDGVRTVIDSGFARIASFEARRGINTLLIRKIARAAAEQRAGRAGRTAPGRCFRLWSEADHAKRAEFESPEVHRVELAEAFLLLKASGVEDLRGFRWLDAPTPESHDRAERLLHDLSATDTGGRLTDEGRQMASRKPPSSPPPCRGKASSPTSAVEFPGRTSSIRMTTPTSPVSTVPSTPPPG
ncbi:MAG: hypothetical protein EOP87_27090, partial [Verrucomicrobiaceae bacterium]